MPNVFVQQATMEEIGNALREAFSNDTYYLPSDMPIAIRNGYRGPSGVYIGEEPPTDDAIKVWLNPLGELTDVIRQEDIDALESRVEALEEGGVGTVPNIQVGTVTTLAAGASATVTRREGSPDSAPIFDYGIPQGIQGAQGIQGPAGANGYTPVKGTDYWTAADKQEIVNEVLAALLAMKG